MAVGAFRLPPNGSDIRKSISSSVSSCHNLSSAAAGTGVMAGGSAMTVTVEAGVAKGPTVLAVNTGADVVVG